MWLTGLTVLPSALNCLHVDTHTFKYMHTRTNTQLQSRASQIFNNAIYIDCIYLVEVFHLGNQIENCFLIGGYILMLLN